MVELLYTLISGVNMISDSQVHKNVLGLTKNHFLSLSNIREWYRHTEERRKNARKLARKDKKLISEFYKCEGYLKDMRYYLRHGDWTCDFYGKDMEHKIQWRVTASRSGKPYLLNPTKKSNGLEDLTDKEYKELKIKAMKIELGLPWKKEGCNG